MAKALDITLILDLVDELRHRNIWGASVEFNLTWAARLAHYFELESAAVSVNYPAYWLASNGVIRGEIEVRRDGTFALLA